MFTNFVRLVLRLVAGAAFIAASAIVVLPAVLPADAPRGTEIAAGTGTVENSDTADGVNTSSAAPSYPVQTFSVVPTVQSHPVVSFDTPKAVMPPTPTPTPTPTATMSSAPVTDKPDPAPSQVDSPPYLAPASVAQAYAATKVPATQFSCLVSLWNRESGWNVHAENPDSGAYGIPQALPGDKMALFGAAWRDDYKTQINWGLNYIKLVYGTPCAAWAHSENFGWY